MSLHGAGYHGPVTPRVATIETERLILRPFNADDFDDLYAYQSRPDVARYLTWGPAIPLRPGRRWTNSAQRPHSTLRASG